MSSMLPRFLNVFSIMDDGGGLNVVYGAPETEGGDEGQREREAKRPNAASNTTLPTSAVKDEDEKDEGD